LKKAGKPIEKVHDRLNGKRRGKPLSELHKEVMGEEMEVEDEDAQEREARLTRKADGKLRSMSRSRSQGAKKVLTETEDRMKRLKQKMQKDWKNSFQGSEADRRIPCQMPRHLVTGIRGNGKTDRR